MKQENLEPFCWYLIEYSKPTSSRYYKGPALYVGYEKYEKCAKFYIPENLHSYERVVKDNKKLKKPKPLESLNFPNYTLFPASCVLKELPEGQPIPLSYHQLAKRYELIDRAMRESKYI